MKLSIRGVPWDRKEARYATKYFVERLLGKRLAQNITLTIHFKIFSEVDIGLCGPNDWEKTGRHREFEIFIDPTIPKSMQLRVLAHELEHLRQYARGELRNLEGTFYRWMGQDIELTKKNEKKVPWEVQAQRSEGWLLHFYSVHRTRNSIFL